ncbi:hypothetical protein [Aliirhizobium cellulosilyticum]|uniref:Uncharacterized protein n=1 Tax=Aliirhizobium cellulosilyticum TaxID=393664 RepID=A0A7W6TLX4_9HYPH|nr:hypothetical protein [Rhizobium cellulosilyticum]MBB4351744.1 hypothetical protein [Rhizobium cellulosilyticum]MBB4414951.1 hypothetical protein [Rhizobium cellulosilyticum]MBB4449670.1 hypothetical protein [Rhizobium cellulosilyticum]
MAASSAEKPNMMDGRKNALVYVSAIIQGDDSGAPPASLVLAEYANAGRGPA